jgi:hypothetical protein
MSWVVYNPYCCVAAEMPILMTPSKQKVFQHWIYLAVIVAGAFLLIQNGWQYMLRRENVLAK